MNGEAFLGPLPDHYHRVQNFNQEKSQDFLGFLDDRTEKVQYNDPRLESVPNYDDPYDIRVLTPEIIKERGVKLRTLDLV